MPEYIRVKDTDTGHEFSVVKGSNLDGLKHLEDAPAVGVTGDPLPPLHAESEPVSYSSLGKGELEEQVAARNAARGPDEQLQVAPPGHKADLVAALEADDAAH